MTQQTTERNMINAYAIDFKNGGTEHIETYTTLEAAVQDLLDCSREVATQVETTILFSHDETGILAGTFTCTAWNDDCEQWAEFTVYDAMNHSTQRYQTRYVLVDGDVSQWCPTGRHYDHTEIEMI